MKIIHIAYIWWTLGVVLLLGEVVLPGLTIFFFGIGAIVVGSVCLFFPAVAASLNLQLLFFLVVSVGALLLLRRSLVRMFRGTFGSREDKMPEDVLGRRVEVAEAISPGRPGKILLNGVHWIAESDDEHPPGDIVEISGRDSLTLRVRRWQAKTPDTNERITS